MRIRRIKQKHGDAPGNGLLNGLVEYWSPTAGVMVGQFAGVNLTNSGTVTFPAGGHLEANSALFNRVDNDYLYKVTPVPFCPQSQTIATWFKIASGAADDAYIFSYYTQGDNPNYPGFEMMWHPDPALGFHFQVATDVNYYYAYAGIPITKDVWHLAIGRYNYPTKSVELRIDNVNLGQVTATGEITAYSDGLFDLSNYYNTGGSNLAGNVNDLGIWNVYKSDADCSVIWNSGAGTPFANFTT